MGLTNINPPKEIEIFDSFNRQIVLTEINGVCQYTVTSVSKVNIEHSPTRVLMGSIPGSFEEVSGQVLNIKDNILVQNSTYIRFSSKIGNITITPFTNGATVFFDQNKDQVNATEAFTKRTFQLTYTSNLEEYLAIIIYMIEDILVEISITELPSLVVTAASLQRMIISCLTNMNVQVEES